MFKPDSFLFKMLSTMFNLIMYNVLFIICCIPLVTAGASWAALYQMISNVIEDSSSSLEVFFSTFAGKLKKTLLPWSVVLVMTALILTDYLFITNTAGSAAAIPGGTYIQVLLVFVFVVVIALSSFLFPLIAMNDQPVKQLLAYSFYLAVSNLPLTILMVILNAAPFAVLFFFPQIAAFYLPVWGLIVFSLVTYADAMIIKHCLAKYNK